MKKYILPFLLLCLVSSCIKVEIDTAECTQRPLAPALTNTTFSKNLGDNLYVALTAPQLGTVYTWYSPNGQKIDEGTSLSLPLNSTSLAGEYSVDAYSSNSFCKSPKTKFTVSVQAVVPSCGMATGTFRLGGSNTLSTSYTNGYEHLEYYSSHWPFGFTDLYIDFGSKPSISEVQAFAVFNTSYPENLNDNQCSIYYVAGSGYSGTAGTVYTKYDNGGGWNITFCDVNMIKGTTNYPNSKANLYCSE